MRREEEEEEEEEEFITSAGNGIIPQASARPCEARVWVLVSPIIPRE